VGRDGDRPRRAELQRLVLRTKKRREGLAQSSEGLRKRLSSPLVDSALTVSLVVAAVYVLWLINLSRTVHDPRDFIRMGHRFIFQSTASSVIKPDPTYHYPTRINGYDGQFYYYLAADPMEARHYMDVPNYRYTRILYPMVARTLAVGRVNLIPYTLILVNLVALGAGTYVIGLWLVRHLISPWFAVFYGLYPGLFGSLQRDLAEPLAFLLAGLGMYLFRFGGRHRIALSAVAFSLAALTRETLAIFPVVYGVGLLFREAEADGRADFLRGLAERASRNLMPASGFLLMSLAPLAVYKLFLIAIIGGPTGFDSTHNPALLPFSGLAAYWPWSIIRVEVIIGVVIPAMISAGLALWAFRRRIWRAEIGALIANVVLFVALLNHLSYGNMYAAGRIAAGVVLAALFCLPAFDVVTRGNRVWIWACGGLWLFLFPSFLSIVSRKPVLTDLMVVGALLIAIWFLSRRSMGSANKLHFDLRP
jgi:hypothetical protein